MLINKLISICYLLNKIAKFITVEKKSQCCLRNLVAFIYHFKKKKNSNSLKIKFQFVKNWAKLKYVFCFNVEPIRWWHHYAAIPSCLFDEYFEQKQIFSKCLNFSKVCEKRWSLASILKTPTNFKKFLIRHFSMST